LATLRVLLSGRLVPTSKVIMPARMAARPDSGKHWMRLPRTLGATQASLNSIAAATPEQNPMTKLLDTCPKVWSWFESRPLNLIRRPTSVVRDSTPFDNPPSRRKINSFVIKHLIAGRSPMEQLIFKCECCPVQAP
jgi:hypothetical protein